MGKKGGKYMGAPVLRWTLVAVLVGGWPCPLPAAAYDGYVQGANYVPSYSKHDIADIFTR